MFFLPKSSLKFPSPSTCPRDLIPHPGYPCLLSAAVPAPYILPPLPRCPPLSRPSPCCQSPAQPTHYVAPLFVAPSNNSPPVYSAIPTRPLLLLSCSFLTPAPIVHCLSSNISPRRTPGLPYCLQAQPLPPITPLTLLLSPTVLTFHPLLVLHPITNTQLPSSQLRVRIAPIHVPNKSDDQPRRYTTPQPKVRFKTRNINGNY